MKEKPTTRIDDLPFGTGSIEDNQKIADTLVETGFESLEVKVSDLEPKVLPHPEHPDYPEPRLIDEDDVAVWKERYFILLDLLNTFRGEK